MLNLIPDSFPEFLNTDSFEKGFQVFLVGTAGYGFIQLVNFIFKRTIGKKLSSQARMILSKLIVYGGMAILILWILRAFGVDSGALLGTAGVLGVAIGFASQSSMSNVVSGIFLITERPFEIGDLIKVGDKTGNVYSIDLLSIKLKTLDNLLIRIPNQTLITTEITNITRFPIRRMDIEVSVAYKEDLDKVEKVLRRIADENPLVLDEPEPLILFRNFGSSSIDILYGLWFEKTDYLKVRNTIFKTILKTFAEEGIEIPFPHISLYTGEATKPFPIKYNSNKE